jgi:large subunit ribosomal protein L31
MKEKIHPEYKKAVVTCSCGNVFETRSTVGDMKIDICYACHPYYTGVQKFLDTDGRVEKFQKRMSKKTTKAEAPKN